MFRLRSAILGAMSLLAVPAITHAQGKSVAHSRVMPAKGAAPSARGATVVVFQDPDRTVFRDYFATHHMVVTNLPPGIAKNLERGKPLPPGIAKQVFPRRVIRRRGLEPDVQFFMVGNNVIAIRSGVVADVMWNVFP